MNLRRASRAITQVYDRQQRHVGLRPTQFTILVVVTRAGPITISKLAAYLVMDRTTVTRNIRPLVEQGLLQSLPGDDRRTRLLAISDTGIKRLKKTLPLWQKTQQSVMAELGQKRYDVMRDAFDSIVALAGEPVQP